VNIEKMRHQLERATTEREVVYAPLCIADIQPILRPWVNAIRQPATSPLQAFLGIGAALRRSRPDTTKRPALRVTENGARR